MRNGVYSFQLNELVGHQLTNSDGSVVINGQPGTWQFTFSKDGYEPISLNYSVTETQTTAAYLQRITD
jgi:hypothetical protein